MADTRTSAARYRALIQLLRTAEDLWNASRLFFARWDLSPSQFNVLNLLHSRPEGLSQSALSQQLIMHRSNATGLVDRLERRGLVRREDDAADRRAYRVVLTAEGNRLLEAIYPRYFAAADRVWADTPPSRVEALLDELTDLAANAAAVAGTEAALASVQEPRTISRTSASRRTSRRASDFRSEAPVSRGGGLTEAETEDEVGAVATAAQPPEAAGLELRTTDL